jgi:UDP:flavonoid glycosyltransferase YjiC (YdhE family)
MKILIASMPATGHVNPMLAIARILMTGGHEVTAKALPGPEQEDL